MKGIKTYKKLAFVVGVIVKDYKHRLLANLFDNSFVIN
ncbi:hypothetical protein SAMN05216390_14010 [Lachnospiraceae bacterium KH1T2]|nr:hypothetical protein SAMN05216390_14010 [Lachnospiraceae bacterium KH1T2]